MAGRSRSVGALPSLFCGDHRNIPSTIDTASPESPAAAGRVKIPSIGAKQSDSRPFQPCDRGDTASLMTLQMCQNLFVLLATQTIYRRGKEILFSKD